MDVAQASIQVQQAQPNSIAGFVFVDSNHSGDFDAATAHPRRGDQYPQRQRHPGHRRQRQCGRPGSCTGADGAFSFGNLPDGNYQLLENYDEAANNYSDGNDFAGLINGVQVLERRVRPVAGRSHL